MESKKTLAGARTETYKMYTVQKKANVYYKLERKAQSAVASTCPIRVKFQDLDLWKLGNFEKHSIMGRDRA